MDRPGAEDQLSGRTDGTQLTVQHKIEAGAAAAGEPQLDRQRLAVRTVRFWFAITGHR